MESYFLLSVGYWNLLGSLILYMMLNESIADRILRQWTEMIAHPYNVGQYGAMWLLWAASTNLFFGVINIFATTWEPSAKTVILYSDLFVYSVLLVPAILTLKNQNYSRGFSINILLGMFWILWLGYLLFTG